MSKYENLSSLHTLILKFHRFSVKYFEHQARRPIIINSTFAEFEETLVFFVGVNSKKLHAIATTNIPCILKVCLEEGEYKLFSS
jgi:hypothetical protein